MASASARFSCARVFLSSVTLLTLVGAPTLDLGQAEAQPERPSESAAPAPEAPDTDHSADTRSPERPTPRTGSDDDGAPESDARGDATPRLPAATSPHTLPSGASDVHSSSAQAPAPSTAAGALVERRLEAEPSQAQRGLLVLQPVARGSEVPDKALELAALKLREVGLAAGYRLVEPEARAAHQASGSHTEQPAAALFRQALAQGADRGIRIDLKVRDDRYHLELLVASLDGQGPLRARGHATPEALGQRIAALAERILPRADQWWGPALPRGDLRAQGADSLPSAHADGTHASSKGEPEPATAAAKRKRFGLAVLYNASLILSERIAHNSQMGARFDLNLNRRFSASVGVTYLNLKGRLSRAHSSALLGQLAFRSFEHARYGWSLPIKLQGGYVFANGGYVRGSLGFAMPLGAHFEWGVDILAPTVWFVPGGELISLDAATDLTWKF